jgi:hypothetical protein
MFDLDDDECLSALPSWDLPGYTHHMAASKKPMGKSAAGKTAKRTTKATTRSKAK